jgi:DNA replication protein DnaC
MMSDPKSVLDYFPGTESRKVSCLKHGEYMATFMPVAGIDRGGACPVCLDENNARLVFEEAAKKATQKADRLKRQDEAARDEAEQRLIAVGVPPRFTSATFDNYDAISPEEAHALSRCRWFVENVIRDGARRAPGLVLHGLFGNGKTHLGCAIINALHRTHRVMRRDATYIIDDIRHGYGGQAQEQKLKIIERYGTYDVLVIDEVGEGYGKDGERSDMFRVLNLRYENELPTILITNLDETQLEHLFGRKALNRFKEDGGKLIGFSGESKRGKVKREGP